MKLKNGVVIIKYFNFTFVEVLYTCNAILYKRMLILAFSQYVVFFYS